MTIKFCKTLLLDIEVTIRTGRDKNPFVSSLNFQTSIIDWCEVGPYIATLEKRKNYVGDECCLACTYIFLVFWVPRKWSLQRLHPGQYILCWKIEKYIRHVCADQPEVSILVRTINEFITQYIHVVSVKIHVITVMTFAEVHNIWVRHIVQPACDIMPPADMEFKQLNGSSASSYDLSVQYYLYWIPCGQPVRYW